VGHGVRIGKLCMSSGVTGGNGLLHGLRCNRRPTHYVIDQRGCEVKGVQGKVKEVQVKVNEVQVHIKKYKYLTATTT
jgi:hypothetical protein